MLEIDVMLSFVLTKKTPRNWTQSVQGELPTWYSVSISRTVV